MGDTFSLDPDQFAAQAPVFHSAGSELAAALERLRSAITTEGKCWGNDEPGRQFANTYQPDATRMVQNLDSLARMLQQTGSSVEQTAEQIGNHDLDLGRYVGNSGATGGIPPTDQASNPSRSADPSTDTTTRPATDGFPTTDGYSGTASNSREGTQPTSESLPVAEDSTSGTRPADSGSPGHSGVQQDPTASQNGQQPGDESGDPGSRTAAVSGSTPSNAANSAAPSVSLADTSAAGTDYGESPMSPPVAAGGSDTGLSRSTTTPATSRPSASGTGESAPRNPWSSDPARRPANKRKKHEKPGKRPSGAIAPTVADRPPGVDPAQQEGAASGLSADPQPDATPWSKPDPPEPPAARSPRKDAAHGATQPG